MPIKTYYRNRLPHIAPIGATFFVTFRLADALPRELVLHYRHQLQALEAQLKQANPVDVHEQLRLHRKRLFGQFEHQLDTQPYGACVLRQPEIADVVLRKLLEYDDKWYTLQAGTIMPNHVHALLDFSCQLTELPGDAADDEPENYTQLDRVMQHLKDGSAYEINKLLGRSGRLWARDTFDHFVRDEEEWRRIEHYILQNPVKAGLVDDWQKWPFTYRKNAVI